MSGHEPQLVDEQLRPCFCFLWHERRDLLEKLELPYGFCGWCESCSEPGHVRHAHEPAGAWCDECWDSMVRESAFRGRRASGAASG